MREREGSRGRHAAPRYQAVAGEEAGRRAASDERRGELARVETARFFHDLRRGMRLARVAVANRVGTQASVIEALETGDLDRLPPWPQTMRLVTAYTELVGMDPRPVLHALHTALAHHQHLRDQEGFTKRLVRRCMALPKALEGGRQGGSNTWTWAAGLSVPTVLAGSLMLTSGLQASQLTRPLASMFGVESRGNAQSIRRLEGLVWIDAADPRQRRSDKLPGTAR